MGAIRVAGGQIATRSGQGSSARVSATALACSREPVSPFIFQLPAISLREFVMDRA